MELPGPTSTPYSLAEIPMAGDQNIGLRGKEPATVDVAGEMSKAYTLTSQMDKQQKDAQAAQDKQLLQEALKNGADMSTPDGALALAEQLKGQVAPATYTNLLKAHDELKTTAVEAETKLAQMDTAKLNQMQKQGDYAIENLSTLLSTYDKTVSEKGVPAAQQDYDAAKLKTIETMRQSKLIPEPMLAQLGNLSAPELKAKVESSKFWQEKLKAAAALKTEGAKAGFYEAQTKEKTLGKDLTSVMAIQDAMDNGEITPEQGAALIKKAESKGTPPAVASMTPDAINMAAERVLAGDTTALQNLGRGAQGGENIAQINNRVAEIAKAKGLSPDSVLKARALLKAAGQGLNTLATRSAKIDAAAIEVDKFADNALGALDKVSRGDILPINDIIRKVSEGSGSPEEVDFATYVKSLSGAYASVISRGNPTVNSQQEADAIIRKDYSKPQFRVMVAALKKEASAVQASSKQAGENIIEESFGKNRPIEDARTPELEAGRVATYIKEHGGTPQSIDADIVELEAGVKNAKGSSKGVLQDQLTLAKKAKAQIASAAPATATSSTGGLVKINSRQELLDAVKANKIKIGGRFIGPDGVERVLKSEPK